MSQLQIYDVVALLKDLPNLKLAKGQVGTIVELWTKDVFEVEFSDKDGRTIATASVKAEDLLLLHFEVKAA